MPFVDVCIANEEDIEKVFGIKAENTDVNNGKLDYDSYKVVASELLNKFNLSKIACTLRTSISASDNKWTAILYDGNEFYQASEYDIHIVDRVGGGDSFGGGLIYSCVNGFDPQATIEFAVAASALKHTINGDFNLVSVDEVESLAGGNANGRVQR